MKRASQLAVALMFATLPLAAKVSQEEAGRLKSTLTPMGGERAGNADGSIPAWDGGYTTSPPCYKGRGSRYCDPFGDDKPLFTVTGQNYQQYAEKLSEGQKAMFEKFPGTYKMNVYKTRRTAAYPQDVYDATYNNALNAELGGGGEALVNAILGIPFPIPKSGVEPVWNHKVRYRGESGRRWNSQAAVTTTGNYNLVKLREDVSFPYAQRGMTPDKLNNVIIYFLQVVTEPPRLAGTITLVHETMDQVKEPRRAWQYNPGQRRRPAHQRPDRHLQRRHRPLHLEDRRQEGGFHPVQRVPDPQRPVQDQRHRPARSHQPGSAALRVASRVDRRGRGQADDDAHVRQAPLLYRRGQLADRTGRHLRPPRCDLALAGGAHLPGLRPAVPGHRDRDDLRPAEQPLPGTGDEQRGPGDGRDAVHALVLRSGQRAEAGHEVSGTGFIGKGAFTAPLLFAALDLYWPSSFFMPALDTLVPPSDQPPSTGITAPLT
jgi:hypothetical protein